MIDYKKEYLRWLSDGLFDEKTKNELKSLTDEKEIEDRFYKNLSFGTGGLRGIIGAGTNRMNFYTVGKATQGLANFINSQSASGSVAIAFDSRNMSKEFALDSALIFAANGVKVYLFDELRPTPELSFAVRHLKTTAGVVITASHNPPEYNGYKVYWSDGAQIVAPYDKLIIDQVNAIEDFSVIKRISKEQAINSGLLQIIGKEIDDAYVAELKKAVINTQVIKEQAENIKIVYSPLNGTGRVPVKRMLSELGFKKVWVVPEQEMPDGNFTTLKYPNPEDPAAFTYALNLAKKVDADIVMATDPDADRLGIYAKNSDGEYVAFTGNMSGLLIAEYELSQMKEKGLLPKNLKDAALVTTIVSSDMAKPIAECYGVTLIEVLTGFKYIGEKINQFEAAIEKEGGYNGEVNAYKYVFGYEESYGCLLGTHCRDKDAVIAVTALCEVAAYYMSKGINLCEQMDNIYKKYGYYKEGLATKVLTGADGAAKIKSIMENLRGITKAEIGGNKVIETRDFLSGLSKTACGKQEKLDLPKSDVLYYVLENGWCCVRPSGTEPKIKFYYGVKGTSEVEAQNALDGLKQALLNIEN